MERLIWWLDRFSFLKHVAAAASIVVKPRLAALHLRRTLGIQ